MSFGDRLRYDAHTLSGRYETHRDLEFPHFVGDPRPDPGIVHQAKHLIGITGPGLTRIQNQVDFIQVLQWQRLLNGRSESMGSGYRCDQRFPAQYYPANGIVLEPYPPEPDIDPSVLQSHDLIETDEL
jgi:hypothetical protein